MAVLIYVPGAMPSFGLNGQPVIATLNFYENDTVTPATVYADEALSTPLTWPLVSDVSGNFPAVWGPDDSNFSVLWSTNDGQSETWDGVNGQTTANGALLAGANAAAAAAETAQTAAETAETNAEAAEAAAQVILDAVIAAGGYDGYSPILAVAVDGARRVLQITGWTGGSGTVPGLGYIGPSGIVATAAEATDIRGSATGDVAQVGSVTAGNLAVWVANGQIEDGGVAGGMANLNLASQAEAEAGSSNTVGMTPLRVSQAIAALGASALRLLTKTANYQLLLADSGSMVDCSGTFTLSFSAAATLGNNWFCYTYNSGTGDVTYDPNGSETIDGLTSFISYPGEIRIVRCNGTGFTSYVLKGFSKAFTASGTFTKPPGYNDFDGELWGGGGAGGKDTGASGGGGGACVPFNVKTSVLGATETVTIGAGGVPGTGIGGDGGNTTLGSVVTAYGGGGGGVGGAISAGGGGGGALSAGAGTIAGEPSVASGLNNPGSGGGNGGGATPKSSIYGGGGGGGKGAGDPAGKSIYGGGGGGGNNGGVGYLGGASAFGGRGGDGNPSISGQAGTAPAGGGGGGATAGGAGARGELRIRGIA